MRDDNKKKKKMCGGMKPFVSLLFPTGTLNHHYLRYPHYPHYPYYSTFRFHYTIRLILVYTYAQIVSATTPPWNVNIVDIICRAEVTINIVNTHTVRYRQI